MFYQRMKIYSIITLFFILSTNAQDADKSFDFIITIDEVIVPSLMNTKIIIQDNNGEKSIPFQYRPGNLSLTEQDYNLIESTNGKIFIQFANNDYTEKEHQVYRYDIEIGKNWFEKTYIILKVYNTSKKKYKKIFEPIEDTNYTFELEYGDGSMLRTRKH